MATLQFPSSAMSESSARRVRIGLSAALAGVLALAIAGYFWVDSRYPSLLKKMNAGKAIHISGGLSFDALIPVTPQMPQ